MPKHNTLKSISSLILSSIKSTPATTTSAAAAKTLPVFDKILKHSVSSLDASSASTPKRTLVKSHKRPQPSKPPSPAHLSSLVSISVDTSSCSDSDGLLDSEGDHGGKPSEDASEVELPWFLLDSEGDHGGKPSEDASEVEVPWFSDFSNYYKSRPRELSRASKKKWVFKKGRVNRVNHFVHSCAERLGTDGTLNLFGKLGYKTSMTEFNALLKICIENASTTDDETVALEQVSNVFEVFMSMKEQGFPIEEESYGQVLLYLIDRGMVEQFHLFTDVIKDGSASTLARLGYYEELLYTRVNDEEKVDEFCNGIFNSDGDETISLRDVVPRAVVDGGDC